MLVYFIVVFSIYFVLVSGLILASLRKHEASIGTARPCGVSVILAVRNEEENLPSLFSSLENLNTHGLEVEFIFVDDHSADNSSARIQEWVRSQATGKARYLLSSGQGKKTAITTGIGQAKGEIILTTDADCQVPPDWVQEVVSSFASDTRMVVGKVSLVSNRSFFADLQAMEFASVMGTGMALLSAGRPVMCNGASLAYTREAFYAVNGYEGNLDVPSGDDEFLMRKVNAKFPGSIRAVRSHTIVRTQPQPSLIRFIHQRLRWAGKWSRNDSLSAKMLAFFILLVQFSTLLLYGFLLAKGFPLTAIILVVIKVFLEALFLYKATRQLNQIFSLPAFISLQVIYPFYVLLIGILSQVAGYEWKGRSSG